MKKFNSFLLMLTFCASLAFMLVGCNDTSPITGIVISNEQYATQAAVDKATQPTELAKDKDLYASVSFIESPKGMKYTAKWLFNDKEIKTEEKEMTTDKMGVIVFTLETGKLEEGTLKLQIIYKGNILAKKEIKVK